MGKNVCEIPKGHNLCNVDHPDTDLVRRWLAHLAALGRSPATLKARVNGLKKLLRFLAGKPLRDVSAEDLAAFRLSLADADFSPHTIELYLTTVRRLFAWLEKQDLLFLNPATDLIVAKADRTARWVLSEQEIKTVLAVPDLSTPVGQRNRAILETAYATAVRRQELIGLTVYDVDLREKTIRVLGKGRKQRMLPLGKHAAQHIAAYLSHGRPKMLGRRPDNPALWLSYRDGKALRHDATGQFFRCLGKKAGLKKPLTCHVLRRTCATALLRNGAHPEMVRMLLGHSSLKTLAQYLNISIRDVFDLHRRSNPGK